MNAPSAVTPSTRCCSTSARIAAEDSFHAPIRPVTERRQGLSLDKRPASTERVYLSYEKDEIDRFARIVRDIPPESR